MKRERVTQKEITWALCYMLKTHKPTAISHEQEKIQKLRPVDRNIQTQLHNDTTK